MDSLLKRTLTSHFNYFSNKKRLNTMFLLDFSVGTNKNLNAELRERKSWRRGEVYTNMELLFG